MEDITNSFVLNGSINQYKSCINDWLNRALLSWHILC
jgi:hypothetical protein